jgi:glycine/D-amino acid oxidase-like deaminating enzyme
LEVLVLGGGQAGLAVGYYLRRTGLSFTIFDAGEEPGGSWRRGWDSLYLATFYLEDAHTFVRDRIAVGGTFGGKLESRPLSGGENVADLRPHLAEGATVTGPGDHPEGVHRGGIPDRARKGDKLAYAKGVAPELHRRAETVVPPSRSVCREEESRFTRWR